MPEGAAFSNGKIAISVSQWFGVKGVIYKLIIILEAMSCSEWINTVPELPATVAERPMLSAAELLLPCL